MKTRQNVEQILNLLNTQNANLKTRVSTAHKLSKLGAFAILPLIEALSSPTNSTRAVAARSLGLLNDKRAILHLLKALDDDDNIVRAEAVTALGLLGDKSIVKSLISTLEDSDPFVRENAVIALGGLGDTSVIEPILKLINDKCQDEAVIISAFNTLCKFNDRKVTDTIIPFLNEEIEQRFRIREYAAAALGQIGDKKVVPHLIRALNDKHYELGSSAARALSYIEDSSIVEKLIEALKSPLHPTVRTVIVMTLGDKGDRKAVGSIIQQLDEAKTNNFMRYRAIEALGKLGDKKALPVLKEMAQDTVSKVVIDDQYFYIKDVAREAISKLSLKTEL